MGLGSNRSLLLSAYDFDARELRCRKLPGVITSLEPYRQTVSQEWGGSKVYG